MPLIDIVFGPEGRQMVTTEEEHAASLDGVAFKRYIEAKVVEIYEPVLGKKLEIGEQVLTMFVRDSKSLPIDILVSITTWGFDASEDEIEIMRCKLELAIQIYLEQHGVNSSNIKVIVNYVSDPSS